MNSFTLGLTIEMDVDLTVATVDAGGGAKKS